MSFIRKLSFRKQSSSDGVAKSWAVATQTDSSYDCKTIAESKAVMSPLQESTVMPVESVETTTVGPMSQDIENKIEFSEHDSIANGIGTAEIKKQQADNSQSDHEPATSEPEGPQSFAIPEGLAIDPMAPTALAVSSEFMERIGSGLTLLRDHGKKLQKYVQKNRSFDVLRRSWKSIVNVVLVEAKDLPDGPATGSNSVYCKFRLGTDTHRSKQVSKTKSSWRERFNLYLYDDNNLEITVWHKGKQKNFMGRCTIDLSQLEKEKTHDLWQELECGYGRIHLVVTLSATGRSMVVDHVPTTNGVHHYAPIEDYPWYSLDLDWHKVGHLTVTVHEAKGLSAMNLTGKANAYCVLELDNSRVQTHTVRGSSEPCWNKCYNFDITDITSTLVITVYDESITNVTIGKISIPLLRVNNDEKRWYALKNRSLKGSARGNCPRILLQMSLVWNPIKASIRVLSPKETKYTEEPSKFDIPLIYSNLKFIRDVFECIQIGNEYYKQLFEWDNTEKSFMSLVVWLLFWYFIRLWMVPLLLLIPFLYKWTGFRSCSNGNALVVCPMPDEDLTDEDSAKDDKTIINRLYELQDLTFTIKRSIDYICSLLERIVNLTKFSVPYLSYLAMSILILASGVLYFLPVQYLFMVLGIYKFTRKVLKPDRVPNNDLLDFLSRVPDDEILKQWRELKVPEPTFNRTNSLRRT